MLTESEKLARKKYQQSEKGKATIKKWWQSEKGKKTARKVRERKNEKKMSYKKCIKLSIPIKYKNSLYAYGYVERETRDCFMLFMKGLKKICWVPKEFVEGY